MYSLNRVIAFTRQLDYDITVEPAVKKKSYWTMLPIGAEIVRGVGFSHVSTDVFQLPLIEGPVVPSILRADNPFDELVTVLAQKKSTVKLCEAGGSILVRVLNPLLANVQKEAMARWTDKINMAYLEVLVKAAVEGGQSLRVDQFTYDMSRFYGAKTIAKRLRKSPDLRKLMKSVNATFAIATGIASDPS